MPAPPSSLAAGNLRGIVAMLGAVCFFACMDASMKLLAAHYPAVQVAALRGLAGLPLVAAYVLWRGEAGRLLAVRWPLHLLRGVLGIAMMASFVYALHRLPLSTAYSIFFVAPLLLTALSVPLLHERVGPRRWAAIATGLVGVVVLLRPGSAGMLSLAALAVLLAATGIMLAAALYLVMSDRTKARAAVMQGFFPAIAVIAGLVALGQTA